MPIWGENFISMDGYFSSLGRFVNQFSDSESAVKFALAQASGVSPKNARAVFSGFRADATISSVRRIFEVSTVKLETYFDEALSQLAMINTVRNDILHNGALWAGEYMVVTNALHTIPRAAKTSRLVIEDLDDMTADLDVIGGRLRYYVASSTPSVPPEMVEMHRPSLQSPWRYKSLSPLKDQQAQGRAPRRSRS